jgi:hypothetical protein
MARDLVTAACVGLDLPLPSGRSVHVRTMPLREAARYLALLESAEDTDGGGAAKAMIALMEEFPDAIGLEEELLPMELFDVVRAFFSHRRPMPATPPASPRPPAAPHGSTTS